MKYVVLLGDGMADDPQPERGNQTPLELADTTNLDRIAAHGLLGLAATVPAGLEPGSDVANLAILGYDPARFHAGRATIEAAALGITLAPGQAAFRMNLVTLGGDPADPVMADYSAGHPTADEQRRVIETLAQALGGGGVRVVAGVSFRNLLVLDGFAGSPKLAPPHDHAGEKIAALWPQGPGAETLTAMIEKSRQVLADHPVNRARAASGKAPIDSVWFWGMGRSVQLESFQRRHGRSGAVVTGVDLIRGLGRLLGMEIVNVAGATGYVDTDFEGKARAALEALERVDFVFLHVEAPDEAGHEGDLELKVQAISDFDRRCVGPLLDGLGRFENWRVLALPDHETPVKERGHRGGLVPFAVVGKAELAAPAASLRRFSEKEAAIAWAGQPPAPAPTLLETRLFCC